MELRDSSAASSPVASWRSLASPCLCAPVIPATEWQKYLLASLGWRLVEWTDPLRLGEELGLGSPLSWLAHAVVSSDAFRERYSASLG